jgi:hypothetical protein
VLATISTFLFAIDFPRARGRTLTLERAQPVRGRDVLLARWIEGALPGLVVAAALGGLAARGAPRIADRALEIALSSALVAIVSAHHGAIFGLRTERDGGASDFAVSAAFPVAAAFLVIGLAIALTISPLCAIGYPVLYARAGAHAARAWECS